MATVTGITVERAEEIEGQLIDHVEKSGKNLIITLKNGQTINAENVFPALVDSWPVGSIFMHTSSTNPNSLLGGGTWVRWGKGRMPISLDESNQRWDTAEEPGGSETVLLTLAQIPSHNHGMTVQGSWGSPLNPATTGYVSADHTHTGYTDAQGYHGHSAWTDTQGNHYHTIARAVAAGSGSPGRAAGGQSTALSDANTSEAGSHAHNVGIGADGSHSHNVTTYGHSTNHVHELQAAGGGGAHDNMPPFIAVYMWKRTG